MKCSDSAGLRKLTQCQNRGLKSDQKATVLNHIGIMGYYADGYYRNVKNRGYFTLMHHVSLQSPGTPALHPKSHIFSLLSFSQSIPTSPHPSASKISNYPNTRQRINLPFHSFYSIHPFSQSILIYPSTSQLPDQPTLRSVLLQSTAILLHLSAHCLQSISARLQCKYIPVQILCNNPTYTPNENTDDYLLLDISVD